jgi:hypothetical protein
MIKSNTLFKLKARGDSVTRSGLDYKPLSVFKKRQFEEAMETVFAINANTSFVTTYPIVFPFGASENVFLISRLYQLWMQNPQNNQQPPQNLADLVTPQSLFEFFTTSMGQIRDYIIQPNVEKCVVGLEEQNNTMQVNEVYQGIVDEVGAENCVYFIKNTWDSLGGTYPCCSFIIKGFGGLDTFANVNEDLFTQIWKNDRQGAGYVQVNTVPVSIAPAGPLVAISPLNMMCYSVYPFQIPPVFQQPFPAYNDANAPIDNSKKLGTRDLGDLFHVTNAQVGDIVYLKGLTGLPTPGLPSPDSGRPLDSAIQRDENGYVTNVFTVIHMLNASLCKRYIKQENDQFVEDNNQTVLQLIGDPAISAAISAHWNTFCLNSLQRHLEAILRDDFGLTVANFNDNTAFYMCGDFNDPTGNIMSALENQGITLFGLNVRFKFGKNNQNNFPITGCPNTNSSLAQGPNPALRPAVGNNFTSLFNAIMGQVGQGVDQDLIDKMRDYFITPINPNYSILNPARLAFKGDNCAKGSLNAELVALINAVIVSKLNSQNLRTDHLLPVVRFTSPAAAAAGGGRRRRRTRRRSARRKSHKRHIGYKHRRYTKKGRRRARHSRKR